MTFIRHAGWCVVAQFASGAVLAQTVEVPTHQPMAGVELTLTMNEKASGRSLVSSTTRSASVDPPRLEIGTEVVVCFTASRSGYITLWSVDDLDLPTRIYPNEFSHSAGAAKTAAPVAEGVQYCLGKEGFSFTVGGQKGEAYQISLNWTPNVEDALPADAYVQIGPRSRSVGERDARFAATHLSYIPTD